MTICPLPWVPAGHWRHLGSSCAGGWETSSCMELRASSVGESLTRRSSGPHFLQFYTAPYSSGTGKDSSLWHPSGAGVLKEGHLGLTGAGRGHEGLGARTSARGSPLLLGDLPHYVQICRRGGAKGSALLCKGGGYLAQSREQLTSELSFSGFSCTREWARPLPVYKRLLFRPYSIQTESYDREYKVWCKLVFERWILETWIRTGLHFQLLGPNPSLSYSRKARVTTQCNQLFQIPLMWQEKSCLMTLRLTAFP